MIAVASPQHHQELIALGASAAVTRPSEVDGPVFGVIDMVGGDFLPESYRVLQDHGGTLLSVGHAAATPEVFEVGDMQANRARFGVSPSSPTRPGSPKTSPNLSH